jgi:hypothetical protein
VFSLAPVESARASTARRVCPLHADSAERALFDSLALKYCPKANLVSDFEARQHMLSKHPREWAAIESHRAELERRQDRDFQRKMLAAWEGPPTDRGGSDGSSADSGPAQ